MEVQINYKGIDLVVKGNYTEGEYEIYYDDDLSGHPGSASDFDVQSIFVIDSDINIEDLFSWEDFNEIKDSSTLAQANVGKPFRIAGLVVDAQHRITKTNRNYGLLSIQDFTGKAELALWSDDYVKFTNYLEIGRNIMIAGFFKQSWKGNGYEFKVTQINLLETAKQTLTKSVELTLNPLYISVEMVNFIEKNMKKNPGKSSLKFIINEPEENLKVILQNNEKGFSMNDDMAEFLINNPEVEVSVGLIGN